MCKYERASLFFFKAFNTAAFAITEFDSRQKQEIHLSAEDSKPALWPTQWAPVAHFPRVAVQINKKTRNVRIPLH